MASKAIGKRVSRGAAKAEEARAAAAMAAAALEARGGAPDEVEPEPAVEEEEEEVVVKAAVKRKRGAAKDGKLSRELSEPISYYDLVEPAPEPQKATRKKAVSRGEKVEVVEEASEDDTDLDDEEEEVVVHKPAKKQKIAHTAKTPAKKAPAVKTPAKKATRTAAPKNGGRQKVVKPVPEEIDEDSDGMDVDDDQAMTDAPPPAWAAGFQSNFINAVTGQTTTLRSEIHTVQETLTDQFTGQFQTLDTKWDNLAAAIDNHSNDIEALGTRFNELDVKHEQQTTAFSADILTKLEEQTATIAADFDTKLDDHTDSMNAKSDANSQKLSGQIHNVAEKLKETQEAIQQHSQDIAKHGQEIEGTNKRVDGIAKEVEELRTKFEEMVKQTYQRNQGDTHYEETKEILGQLSDTCLDTEERTKTILKEFDELKRMVCSVESRTRHLIQEGGEEDYNDEYDYDHEHEPDSDMGSDHEGEGDSDEDSHDESGNGGGVRDAVNNGTDEFKEVSRDRADEQLQRRNIDRVVTEEDEVDYGNSTMILAPPGEHRGQQSTIAVSKQVNQVPNPYLCDVH